MASSAHRRRRWPRTTSPPSLPFGPRSSRRPPGSWRTAGGGEIGRRRRRWSARTCCNHLSNRAQIVSNDSASHAAAQVCGNSAAGYMRNRHNSIRSPGNDAGAAAHTRLLLPALQHGRAGRATSVASEPFPGGRAAGGARGATYWSGLRRLRRGARRRRRAQEPSRRALGRRRRLLAVTRWPQTAELCVPKKMCWHFRLFNHYSQWAL